jgi:hypothetical protein
VRTRVKESKTITRDDKGPEQMKALRTVLNLSQKGLAEKIKFSRVLVIACENGDRKLSTDMNVRLGNLAFENEYHEVARYFWGQAGVNLGAINTVVLKSIGKQTPAGALWKIPHTTKVRPHDGDDSPLMFPISRLPNPKAATYVRLDDNWYAPLFRSGDVMVVDESETDVVKLKGECVVCYRSPESAKTHHHVFDAGIFPAGEKVFSRTKKEGTHVEGMQISRSGVFAAWLLTDLRESMRKKEVINPLVPSRLGGLLTEEIYIAPPDVRAPHAKDFVIVGRVLAWLPDFAWKSEK